MTSGFDLNNPYNWPDDDVVNGKLYRFVDAAHGLPLIEVRADEMVKLANYEIFEPDWVVARAPTVFVLFDSMDQIIYGPLGVSEDYSLLSLLQAHGYASVDAFYEEHAPGVEPRVIYEDMDIWLRLGLRAKIYIPSLPVKDRGQS